MDPHEILSMLNNSDDNVDWNNSEDEDSTDGEEEILTVLDWLNVAEVSSFCFLGCITDCLLIAGLLVVL